MTGCHLAPGGEQVLDAAVRLFPDAEIFTLIHEPGSDAVRASSHRPIHTSSLQRVPGIAHRYRHLLPLLPARASLPRPRGLDLVVSSSHCVAKGVRKPAGRPHLGYVHAPMRYMWDLFDDYFGPGPRLAAGARGRAARCGPACSAGTGRPRPASTASSPTASTSRGRLRRFWGREADVVHPPVELERFAAHAARAARAQGGYFLWLGALAPYKRLDLALEAFRRTGRAAVGRAAPGRRRARLRERLPPNVRLLGQVPRRGAPGALPRRPRAGLHRRGGLRHHPARGARPPAAR